MMTRSELEEMAGIDITKADHAALAENPYCFMSDKTPVKIQFDPDGAALEDVLLHFFIGLKNR